MAAPQLDHENVVVQRLIKEIVKKSTLYTMMISEQNKTPGVETGADKFIRDIVEEEVKINKRKLDFYQN